ncbi:hypothetical protein ABZ135_32660 [Streptomyces sp. NPDC006339]|uniref:hypothetical protein n=1 Tax=Streptomyces sp. NPDC006339 TaxID=3156755 RepID=UPI00339F3A41
MMAVDILETKALRGLTIKQPWADAVAYLGKDIENRTWRTTYTGPLLIHAGLRVDQEAAKQAPATLPGVRGAVIATARLKGCHRCDGECSRWAEPGVWHWELTDVRALDEPVRVSGARGLWIPDEDLRSRMKAATSLLPRRSNCEGSAAP